MKIRDRLPLLAVLCCFSALLLLPEVSAQAARDAMLLCAQTLIPSLFPFFVLSSLLIACGASELLSALLSPLMRPLFGLSGAGAAALAGQNSLGGAVTVPLTPRALTERLRDGSLLQGLFLCFLEAHFLRDFTVFGGFYQPTYLAEMRRGLVCALRETGGYETEAAIIEAKRSAMTLGLIYLLRSRESGSFPVSTAELLEEPVSMLEIEASLQVSIAAALEHLN